MNMLDAFAIGVGIGVGMFLSQIMFTAIFDGEEK